MSVILTAAGDYKWLLTHQCTIGANITQQRALKKGASTALTKEKEGVQQTIRMQKSTSLFPY